MHARALGATPMFLDIEIPEERSCAIVYLYESSPNEIRDETIEHVGGWYLQGPMYLMCNFAHPRMCIFAHPRMCIFAHPLMCNFASQLKSSAPLGKKLQVEWETHTTDFNLRLLYLFLQHESRRLKIWERF